MNVAGAKRVSNSVGCFIDRIVGETAALYRDFAVCAATEKRKVKLADFFVPPETELNLVTIAVFLVVAVDLDWIWQNNIMKLKCFFNQRSFVMLLGLKLHDLPRAC
ncbi:hypothetical protein D3C72_1624710 [compost metagenome]